jgi:hypothetical protein
MTANKRLSLLQMQIFAILAAANYGCKGGSSGSPSPFVNVSVSPSAFTVQAGATQNVIATVTNDDSNRGVTWTASCSSIPCGTVSPPFTLSGTPTTYTPPVTLPAADLSVTLTATSVANPAKSATAAITVPQLSGFVGISEAHVDSVNGMARLIINGKPAPPLWFEYQENFPTHVQFLAPQVQDAAAHGIHIFSIELNSHWPWDNQGVAPLDFSAVDQLIDNITRVDPQAGLVLNIGVWPGPGWRPPVAPTSGDYSLYADGSTTDPYHMSLASDIFFNGFLTSLPHLLQHYENSSYAAHILGYIINGGNTGEWFPVDIWRGPDYSPVNTQAFEKWLQNKYGNDAALSAAWGRSTTIAGAQVPPPQAGRFPIIGTNVFDQWNSFNAKSGTMVEAFYQLPQEQDWVDYSAYVSDLTSQRILDAAKVVRAQTGGKRLVGVHNGYLVELLASFNGHLRFDRLLASPDLDFFGGAITYLERLAGGAGQEGAVVDSVNAHGKLWFNETDLYTYLAANGPFASSFGSNLPTSNLTETVDVLEREIASLLVHRSGTWWFDIGEEGGFNDPAIWGLMSDYGIPLFNQLYSNPQPYKPDVALVIDRNSILYQKVDMDMMGGQRGELRYALAKSGVAYGIYTLDDFLDGVLPPCKVYIFANTNYLTDAQIAQIQSRLNTEASTAIWQYAPGFLGPNGADVTRASNLTGIQLSQSDGYTTTSGSGLMAGYTWGVISSLPSQDNHPLSPRLVVTDPIAEALGTYQTDGLVSTARRKVGNFESIFSGAFTLGDFDNPAGAGFSPSPNVLRALLQIAGVHIWSTTGDVVITDGNLLVIHAAAAGPDTISLPAGVTATPLGGGPSSTGTLNISFSRVGQTLWFRLS